MPDGGALHFPEQFRRWFDYEKDAHARVVTSLHTVPDAIFPPDYQRLSTCWRTLLLRAPHGCIASVM